MADIIIDDITNAGGTGVFDVLMAAVDSRINTQYLDNRITGSDYANVYLGSIQAVLQAAVQYNMQEQLTEAQIDIAVSDNLLKAEQIKLAYTQRVLADKQAAKLGLDNVMKLSEEERSSNPNHVYTPRYEEV